MKCPHRYFHLVDSVLICSQCKEPRDELDGQLEDKMQTKPQDKRLIPPQVKRIKRKVLKN